MAVMTPAQPEDPPKRPSPERLAKLAELADWHRRWARRNLGASSFTARKRGSDYNLHHVDVDGASAAAEAEFHRRARRIMGIRGPAVGHG